jgi:prephenate dehydrogenase
MSIQTIHKVAIVGGYGNMGQWFARFLAKEGKQVVISGRDQEKLREAAGLLGVESASNEQAVATSDAVILSVPINSFEAVVKEIAPHTHAGQYIFDITSIKLKPVDIMHKYIKKGTALGVHPMFGPGAKGIKGQRFVLTPTGTKEQALAEKTKAYLEGKGAKVELMKPGEHDEIMSVVLGLSHFIALVSADTLLHLDKLENAREISGTSYRLLLTLAEGVVSEDPEFYSSLQMNLPGLAVIEKLFQSKAGEWAGLVSKGDRREFAKRMRELKAGFETKDPGFSSAYNNMYRLIGE